MTYYKFIEYCESQNAIPKTGNSFEHFVTRVQEVFGDTPTAYDAGNSHKLYALFESTKNRPSISHTVFYVRKKYVKLFYQWLYDQGLVSDEMMNRINTLSAADVIENITISTSYFANFDSVLAYIDRVVESENLDPSQCLQDVKCIATLAWAGCGLKAICEAKKSDVYGDFIIINGTKYPLEKSQHDAIKYMASLDAYKSFPGGKQFDFVESEYLLRSSRADRFTEDSVRCTMNRFNSKARKFGCGITVEDLRNNGIFFRAFMYETSVGVTPNYAIQHISGRPRSNASALTKIYIVWRNHFGREIEN